MHTILEGAKAFAINENLAGSFGLGASPAAHVWTEIPGAGNLRAAAADRSSPRPSLTEGLQTLRRLLIAAGLFGVLVGSSFADPAITTAPSNMHRRANPHSAVVQAVPADAQIDIQGCRGEWCYGSWRGIYGFLPAFAVTQAGPPPAPPMAVAPPPLAVTAPVVVAPAPVWGGPYVGVGWGYGWRRW